jgi:hypothetical protein
VDPELLAKHAAGAPPEWAFAVDQVWNRRLLDTHGCDPNALPWQLPQPLMVFDPPEPTPHPPFRYFRSVTTPLRLTTNRFGWRGPDVPLDKPPRTVRLAFVGASTTVGNYGLPFSYPEYVVSWLNRWAEATGLDVRFDGINAGRVGINSTDIAAVVRQEVVPMEPDAVVYYEGANNFIFAAPPAAEIPPARSWQKGRLPLPVSDAFRRVTPYSALARRVERLGVALAARGGREPAKPPYRLRWPAAELDADPDVDRADLPLDLSTVVRDLDDIRSSLAATGAELVVTSFVWLVRDGLTLDPFRDAMIYTQLNDRWWPYRYADLRRFADYQNRAFARYAAARGTWFVDVAGAFPPDTRLFLDAIHFDEDGTRVQAWIVFNGLVPSIRARLASGAWPRPDRTPLDRHPAFGPEYPLTLVCPPR